MSPRNDTSATEALRDEALGWLVRVQSDAATGEDWSALTDWLEASEQHQAAFQEVETLAAEVADQAAQIAPRLAASTGEVLAFRPRPAAPRRARFIAALAAAAAVLVVSPITWRAYQGSATVYETRVGQIREIALADGSHIRLNGGSKLTVRLGWRARRVEMAQAEAAFDVAKDPSRPFLISVGDQQVRVVGTEFNIRHDDKTTVVSVRRGVVEVRQPSLGAAPVARLTVGQALRHLEGARVSRVSAVSPDAAFAWTQGRMVCDDQPLSEIVAALNRRYPIPIRVSETVGRRRFSGVLDLGDQGVLVDRLSRYLSLSVVRTGAEITLR
ncbi:FecR family protein [soil metagenome]